MQMRSAVLIPSGGPWLANLDAGAIAGGLGPTVVPRERTHALMPAVIQAAAAVAPQRFSHGLPPRQVRSGQFRSVPVLLLWDGCAACTLQTRQVALLLLQVQVGGRDKRQPHLTRGTGQGGPAAARFTARGTSLHQQSAGRQCMRQEKLRHIFIRLQGKLCP